MDKKNLAEIPHRFYPSARQKPEDDKIEWNHVQSSRSAINRHLQLPPFNKTWDLVKDNEFKADK